jgi:hypothetical protein
VEIPNMEKHPFKTSPGLPIKAWIHPPGFPASKPGPHWLFCAGQTLR